MGTFDDVPKPGAQSFPHGRTHAHLAAQLVAAAGVTWLEPDPDFHFSSTTFDPESGALVGIPLPGDRRVRLVLDELRLDVVDHGAVADSRLLGGSTMAEAVGEAAHATHGAPIHL
jgi:hypothetical protein